MVVNYSEIGAHLNSLKSEKMRKFCLEYPIDYNGKKAAIRAGYAKSSAAVMAVKLLKNTIVKKILGKQESANRKRLEVDANEILEQLVYCATRSGVDYVDDNGRVVSNLNDLPERAQQAIDGIEQTDFYDENGDIKSTKMKLKLVPKLGSLDLAMKHKGLFATEKKETKLVMDWDSLLQNENPKTIDVEVKRIEEKHEDQT